MLLYETFEGPGYRDGSWPETISGGTIDDQYLSSGPGMEGIYCLHWYNSGNGTDYAYAIRTLSASYDEVWVKFIFRVDTLNNYWDVITFRDVGGDSCFGFWVEASPLNVLKVGLDADYTVCTIEINKVYYIWAHYKRNTGGPNGIMEVYVSETSTRPGTPIYTTNTHANPGSVNKVEVFKPATAFSRPYAPTDAYLDHICLDNSGTYWDSWISSSSCSSSCCWSSSSSTVWLSTPTFQEAGAGVVRATTGTLTPAYPITGLLANDLFILHVTCRNNTTTVDTPAGFSSLFGPDSTGSPTPLMRSRLFARRATGSETGTVTVSFGSDAAIAKMARIYRFRGNSVNILYEGGVTLAGTDNTIEMPNVSSAFINSLAVAFIFHSYNNAVASATGETGGDWVEAVAEYTTTTGGRGCIQLQTADLSTGKAISGGAQTISASRDWGVRAFTILNANESSSSSSFSCSCSSSCCWSSSSSSCCWSSSSSSSCCWSSSSSCCWSSSSSSCCWSSSSSCCWSSSSSCCWSSSSSWFYTDHFIDLVDDTWADTTDDHWESSSSSCSSCCWSSSSSSCCWSSSSSSSCCWSSSSSSCCWSSSSSSSCCWSSSSSCCWSSSSSSCCWSSSSSVPGPSSSSSSSCCWSSSSSCCWSSSSSCCWSSSSSSCCWSSSSSSCCWSSSSSSCCWSSSSSSCCWSSSSSSCCWSSSSAVIAADHFIDLVDDVWADTTDDHWESSSSSSCCWSSSSSSCCWSSSSCCWSSSSSSCCWSSSSSSCCWSSSSSSSYSSCCWSSSSSCCWSSSSSSAIGPSSSSSSSCCWSSSSSCCWSSSSSSSSCCWSSSSSSCCWSSSSSCCWSSSSSSCCWSSSSSCCWSSSSSSCCWSSSSSSCCWSSSSSSCCWSSSSSCCWSSSSKSSSCSCSSSSSFILYGYTWGEQNPIPHTPETWAFWTIKNTLSVARYSSDWGKLQLITGDEFVSPVKDLLNDVLKRLTITYNTYAVGYGPFTIQWRGSTSGFLQDSILPAWANYTGPFNTTYRFIQIKVTGT